MNATTRMLSRRTVAASLCLLSMTAQLDEVFADSGTIAVRLRADSTVVQGLPPDVRQNLRISQDSSPAAKKLAAQSPPGRFVPIILIAVGVMSIPILYSSVREMVRQTYFGGVIIDARTTPVSVINSKSIPENIVLYIAPNGKPKRYSAQDITPEVFAKFLGK
jgi:hypothetical protein